MNIVKISVLYSFDNSLPVLSPKNVFIGLCVHISACKQNIS